MTDIPREFAFATPADLGDDRTYRRFCRNAGLPPTRTGYGLLLVEDQDGLRWTRITDDVEYLRLIAAAPPAALADLDLPGDKFLMRRAGWPDDWPKIR